MRTYFQVISGVEYIPTNCDDVEVFATQEEAQEYIKYQHLSCPLYVARVVEKSCTDEEYAIRFDNDPLLELQSYKEWLDSQDISEEEYNRLVLYKTEELDLQVI